MRYSAELVDRKTSNKLVLIDHLSDGRTIPDDSLHLTSKSTYRIQIIQTDNTKI